MPIAFYLASKNQRRYLFEEVLSTIAENFDPDDVFSDDALAAWALDNGYIRPDDCPEAK